MCSACKIPYSSSAGVVTCEGCHIEPLDSLLQRELGAELGYTRDQDGEDLFGSHSSEERQSGAEPSPSEREQQDSDSPEVMDADSLSSNEEEVDVDTDDEALEGDSDAPTSNVPTKRCELCSRKLTRWRLKCCHAAACRNCVRAQRSLLHDVPGSDDEANDGAVSHWFARACPLCGLLCYYCIDVCCLLHLRMARFMDVKMVELSRPMPRDTTPSIFHPGDPGP